MWLEKHGDGVSFDALPNHHEAHHLSVGSLVVSVTMHCPTWKRRTPCSSRIVGCVVFRCIVQFGHEHIISVLIQELYPFRGIAHSCQVAHHLNRSDVGCMRIFNVHFVTIVVLEVFHGMASQSVCCMCIVILDVMDSFFHLIWLLPMLSHESCWCHSQFGHEAQHL